MRNWRRSKGEKGEREGLPDAQYCDHEYVKMALDESSAAETENGVWRRRTRENTMCALDVIPWREARPNAAMYLQEQIDGLPDPQWLHHSAEAKSHSQKSRDSPPITRHKSPKSHLRQVMRWFPLHRLILVFQRIQTRILHHRCMLRAPQANTPCASSPNMIIIAVV